MKRIMTLLLAAGLVFGATAGSAKAVELTANGTWQFGWTWMQAPGTDTKDTFKAKQRLRTQFNFIASEDLKGVLFTEIGNGDWGGKDGWATGTDGKNIKVRYAYVDWVVPGADIKVRMGLQPVGQPTYTFNRPVMGDAYDVAGITANYQFNDMVGLTLAWTRPYNNDEADHDSVDLFMLAVPVTGEGWAVTPYGMYASVGSDAMWGAYDSQDWGSDIKYMLSGMLPVAPFGLLGANDWTNTDSGNAWWLGIGGELTMFDPFRVALDFVYGYADLGNLGNFDLKRRGWTATAEASYTLDFVTPTLRGWYSSGDDSNYMDGSERIPGLRNVSKFTNFGFDGGWYDADQLAVGSDGKWGIGLHFDNIQVIEALKHDLRFSYIQGTNNRAMADVYQLCTDPATNGMVGSEGIYMTTSDKAWEIDFDTKYDIYKNLAMHVELSYIKLDFDEATWGNTYQYVTDDDAYKAGIYLTYKF